MRRLRRQINKTIREAQIGLIVLLSGVGLVSALPTEILVGTAITFLIVFCLWVLAKPSNKNKYINEHGYVVLVSENDLEHRHIAKTLLNRNLNPNEVVHHINGRKTDNKIYNLCLMDNSKHELFHSWLSWKKKKTGKYPSFKEQKRILAEEYNGTLLEYIVPKISVETAQSPQIDDKPNVKEVFDSNLLFEELRKERLQIARELKLPAYLIFYDKTLHRMAHIMPDTDELMLKTVGPSKYQMYGSRFIAVVKAFKTNTNSNGRVTG